MRVNEIITQKILDELKKGVVPWHRPWKISFPKNLVSKKPYRGINVILLSIMGRSSPWWVTYKQSQELGGNVKKGAHGAEIVYYTNLEYPDEDPTSDKVFKKIPYLRYYRVFNTDDCEGLESKIPPTISKIIQPIEECEKVVGGYTDKPVMALADRAAYSPGLDHLYMPAMPTFESAEFYYAVLFHEFVHSTGHKSRLDRDTITDRVPFGTTNYSREELIAEIGSIFLYSHVGISGDKVFDNSLAYLNSWSKKLTEDSNMIFKAANRAQKAFDHILKVKEVNE